MKMMVSLVLILTSINALATSPKPVLEGSVVKNIYTLLKNIIPEQSPVNPMNPHVSNPVKTIKADYFACFYDKNQSGDRYFGCTFNEDVNADPRLDSATSATLFDLLKRAGADTQAGSFYGRVVVKSLTCTESYEGNFEYTYACSAIRKLNDSYTP